MTYLPEENRIIYRYKDNRQEKAFNALDWLVPPWAGFVIKASIVTFPGDFVKKKNRMPSFFFILLKTRSSSCTPQTSIFEKRQDFKRYSTKRRFKFVGFMVIER